MEENNVYGSLTNLEVSGGIASALALSDEAAQNSTRVIEITSAIYIFTLITGIILMLTYFVERPVILGKYLTILGLVFMSFIGVAYVYYNYINTDNNDVNRAKRTTNIVLAPVYLLIVLLFIYILYLIVFNVPLWVSLTIFFLLNQSQLLMYIY